MKSRSAAIVSAAERITSSPNSQTYFQDMSVRFSPKLSHQEAEVMLSLTRSNMRSLYDACHEEEWKWNDVEKLKSLLSSKSRFFIIEKQNIGIVGFICFRFLVDNKRPVVYIFELQVDAHFTGQGIGAHLLSQVENLCRKSAPGISECILTCFRHNERPIAFYTRQGFKTDMTSPHSSSYLILSKMIG